MLNLIEMMEEGTKHIVRASDLGDLADTYDAGHICLGDLGQLTPVKYGVLSFEPCALYRKKSMELVPAFIVKKGSGPYVWTRTHMKFMDKSDGEPVIFTDGKWDHTYFAKTIGSNFSRKYEFSHRNTLICVRNIKSDSASKVVHDIFKVVEVICG